jgi:hypothetical protein
LFTEHDVQQIVEVLEQYPERRSKHRLSLQRAGQSCHSGV